MSELTYEEAHRLFRYDAETGKLYWRVSRGNVKAGYEAGSVWRQKSAIYRLVMCNKKFYFAHRIIWLMHYGSFPENTIDHYDGNGLNNRIENLRDVTAKLNSRNSKMHKNNTSGVNGVYWKKDIKKWCARSYAGSRSRKFLGCFTDIHEAEKAVREYQQKQGFTERHGGNTPSASSLTSSIPIVSCYEVCPSFLR